MATEGAGHPFITITQMGIDDGQPENMFLASMYEDTDLVKQELSEENSKDDPDYKVEYDSHKEVKSKRPGRIPLKNKKVLSL